MLKMDRRLWAPETGADGGVVYTQAEVDVLLAQAAEAARQEKERAVSEARAAAEQAAAADAAQQAAMQEQDAREAAIALREKEIERRELRARALEELAAQELPLELAEALDYADEASLAAALERVKAAWSTAVLRGIEERMKGTIPRAGSGQPRPGTLREAIESHYRGGAAVPPATGASRSAG